MLQGDSKDECQKSKQNLKGVKQIGEAQAIVCGILQICCQLG